MEIAQDRHDLSRIPSSAYLRRSSPEYSPWFPTAFTHSLTTPSTQRFDLFAVYSSFVNPLVMDYLINDGKRTEGVEASEGDRIVDGMDFGELCDEFECRSSPQVESTARQLVRDILELREGNRALGTFAISVKYKARFFLTDPVRSFSGRDKYKRPLWTTDALDKPSVSVHQMLMLSTSVLIIQWTIKGKPKSVVRSISGDVIIKVKSQFTLNQISGQVIEHEESWDLSASSAIAQAYFWTSRRIYATTESGKDVVDSVKDLAGRMSTKEENLEIYPDPSGDPTKFFQTDDGFQRDVYQLALLGAVLYFIVQFLRTTL
ncbi:unnamed protein product [Rhodiola kirilowii]